MSTDQTSDSRSEAVLLLGPTGTGKSSFIARTTNKAVPVGKTLSSCTQECRTYSYRNLVLVDTPGFDDSSTDNLVILDRIVTFLATHSSMRIVGMLFFFDITQNKITGPTALIIEILKGISGAPFYAHVGIVTTMWDTVPDGAATTRCEARAQQLPEAASFAKPFGRPSQNFRFLGTQASGQQILDDFATSPVHVAPLLVEEIRRQLSTEDTSAAKPIREDRKRRVREIEEATPAANGNQRQPADSLPRPAGSPAPQSPWTLHWQAFKERLHQWLRSQPNHTTASQYRPLSPSHTGHAPRHRKLYWAVLMGALAVCGAIIVRVAHSPTVTGWLSTSFTWLSTLRRW